MQKAYARLDVKEMSRGAEQITIKGIASSPTVDRMGDRVNPMGAKFKTPLPLLLYHDSKSPVGQVRLAKPTKTGIPFEATIPIVKEPGVVQDRTNEAIHSLQYDLIGCCSIGFNPDLDSLKRTDTGYDIESWEWLELSLVPIPAQPDAVITGIKSFDTALRAASGQRSSGSTSPGASGNTAASRGNSSNRSPKGNDMKTLTQLREERTTKAARLNELAEMLKADDHTVTAEEEEEFDILETEIKSLDTDIRVARATAVNASTAKGVDGTGSAAAARSRINTGGGMSFTRNADPDDKFKGQGFVRSLIAKAASFHARKHGGNLSVSDFAAQRWGKSNPQMIQWIKANEITGGGTGSGEWGAELVGIDNRYNGDFVDFLYAMTVFDRLGLRPAPKNVSVKGQDGAAVGYWTGESKGIPVSKPDFSTVDLTMLKAAGIVVASKELLADSDPAAEMLIRDSLVEAIAQRIDTTFLSVTAASAGVSPAGILNGVTALHTSGTDEAAVRSMIKALYSQFITDKNASDLKLVMSPGMAKAIGLIVNALGQTSFPGLGAKGGVLLDDPVITGDNVDPSTVLLIKPRDIWLIGDSGVDVSMSDSAMIEQNSAPLGATDTPTAASVTLTSMFQEDSVAIKVVRRLNYKKRRANAVAYVDDADFDGTVS